MLHIIQAAATTLAALILAAPAMSQPNNAGRVPRTPPARAVSMDGQRSIALETGAGRIVALNAPATNVFVADPKVAEVRPASSTSLFVFGVGPGRTTVAVMDQDGQSVAQYEITVRPSMFNAAEAQAAAARLLPGSSIRVTPQARGLLLTGSVESAAESARVLSIMRGYVPEGQVIENQLAIRSAVQVTLKVRLVEMNRNVSRALGIDWQAMGSIGRFGITAATANGLGLGGAAAGLLRAGTSDFNAILQALASDNLARILAEPNLTVMSGQTASFLAGGEFPIPVNQRDNVVTVEFKKFGVSLAFVPTVLSEGRINLHVSPEVSQITDTGTVRLSDSKSSLSLSVPGLTVRRAETTVELGSGQSFAIAGLLQDNVLQNSSGLPLLGDLPIIGSLFRSSSFQRQETELVMLVTPYVVRPVSDPATLATPADGFTPATDLERILLLRQVGTAPGAVPVRIPGNAGFVVQ